MKALLLVALLSTAASSFAAGFAFPSSARCLSPDGRWELKARPPRHPERNAGHLLVLKKVRGPTVRLQRFDRSCEVLWSPDSARIAVTDWQASDMSDVLIYSVARPTHGQSVARLLPKGAIPTEEREGHGYFEASKWLDSRRLQIKVWGHRDSFPATSFEHRFVFDTKTSKIIAEGVTPVRGGHPAPSSDAGLSCPVTFWRLRQLYWRR